MDQMASKHALVLHTLGPGFTPEDETDWGGLRSKSSGLEIEALDNPQF